MRFEHRAMPPNPRADLAILALAVLGCTTITLLPPSNPAARFVAADHPAAVLAWARARCAHDPALLPPAVRVHADDLLIVASNLDAAARRWDLERTCATALAIAKPVLALSLRPSLPGQPEIALAVPSPAR